MDGSDSDKRPRGEELGAEDEVSAKRFREADHHEQDDIEAIDLADDQEVEEEEEDQQLDDPLFDALVSVQSELEQLNEEAAEQALALEQHFVGKKRPVFARRNQVIKGLVKFWQICLSQHPALKDALTSHDYAILGYCTEVDVEDHSDVTRGFKITFRFENCPHFNNTELVKEFSYMDNETMQIQSSLPLWNPGFEPADENDTLRGTVSPEYLFFNWFKTVSEELPAGEHDEIANIIKDEIWPNPLKFYTAQYTEEMTMEVRAVSAAACRSKRCCRSQGGQAPLP
ncbi:MAG: hypothetical protein WDW38_011416 [Sanguina aurantia]